MRRKLSLLLIISILFSLGAFVQVYAGDLFAGQRSVVCVIRQSDVDNFISGGRDTLNTILAQNQEQWYACTLQSKEHEVEISLEFSFDSYADYMEKVEYLIGSKPITTYAENSAYIENFLPQELFQFMDAAMQDTGVVEEQCFCEMLRLKQDMLKVNGTVYFDRSSTEKENREQIQFKDIRIHTELLDEIYVRTIEVSLEKESRKVGKVLQSRSADIGMQWEENNYSDYKIEFRADSEQELIKNTMILLGTAVNITHNKCYKSDKIVRMSTREKIELESILTENGTFSYVMTVPESCENLGLTMKNDEEVKADEAGSLISMNGYEISYQGKEGCIEYCYDSPFQFEKIAIVTDLSDEFQRTKRSITLYLSKSLAEDYHDMVKDLLWSRVERGDLLHIYDTAQYRCYEVCHSSWFADELGQFTDRIFQIKNSKFVIERPAIPFQKSKISDRFQIEKGDIKSYSEQVELTYLLPKNTEITEEIIRTETGIKYEVVSAPDISVKKGFLAFHYKKMIVCLSMGVFGILMIAMGLLKIKRKIVHWKARKERDDRKTKNNIVYCSKCGHAMKKGSTFCSKCGNERKGEHK